MALPAILGDVVKVELGETVELQPTLRAGIEVLGLHGSFDATLGKLADVDTLTIQRLVEIGSDRPARELLMRAPLPALAAIADPLADFLLILANGGTRPQLGGAGSGKATGSGLSHADFFARLFKIGTGWLGWTYDQTLDAPMPAIISAYAGRQDMLRSIFGGSDAPRRNDIPLDEKVRQGFAFLGTRKVTRGKRS